MATNRNAEYPGQLKPIPHTKLAYMITPCAVNESNGFDKFFKYLSQSTDRPKRVLRSYCLKIYKAGNKTLEELKKDIDNNEAVMLGDSYFEVTNQNLALDENNNLCLRTYGSDLENLRGDWYDCLVSADGQVLRKTNGSMVFSTPDAYGNYFAICFVSKSKPMTDQVDIVRLDYNFLTPDGHKISKTNFTMSQEQSITPITRTYSHNNGEKMFIDSSKTVYPTGYIYNGGSGSREYPIFLPSATAVLIENRSRIADGRDPIVEDETPYLEEHYKRLEEQSAVHSMLTKKYNKGQISYQTYKHAMTVLDVERFIDSIFGNEFERPEDMAYAEEDFTF